VRYAVRALGAIRGFTPIDPIALGAAASLLVSAILARTCRPGARRGSIRCSRCARDYQMVRAG
jgi:hypothetical protein